MNKYMQRKRPRIPKDEVERYYKELGDRLPPLLEEEEWE